MADISYTPTTWADGSGGGTPIDATKLNNIESGIVDAVAAIGPNDTTADGTLKAQIDAIGESVSKFSYMPQPSNTAFASWYACGSGWRYYYGFEYSSYGLPQPGIFIQFVAQNNADSLAQLLIATDDSLYYRRASGSTLQSWRKITGTV